VTYQSDHVFGQAPDLAGTTCEAVLVQRFVVDDQPVSAVNVVFLKASGAWHRLALDAGTIHWRVEPEAPVPFDVPDRGWRYPHEDFGSAHGLVGIGITGLTMHVGLAGCRVDIAFRDGRHLEIHERDDLVHMTLG
jgi:hypothetical protein